MDAVRAGTTWSAWLRELVRLWPWLAGALLLRYVCYCAMTLLALWNEGRRAPSLPDVALEHLPYVAWIDHANYWAWLAIYLPLAAALLLTEPRRWIRYMVTGALVSLARGVCIVLTTLGPPDEANARAGVAGRTFWEAYLELISPVGVFAHGSIKAWLSQDLFFSGHAATTFLLVLYLWHRPGLRCIALLGHVAMVAAVLLSRLHYSIDVVGAWAIAFAIYALREWRPR